MTAILPKVTDNQGLDVTTQPAATSMLGAWCIVVLLCLAQIISTMDRGMLSLVVDPVRHDLSITDMQIALLQGVAFSVFYVLAGVALGLVTDVVSRKWLLIAGISVWSAATLATGLAENFTQMFVARLLIGTGEAVMAPCAITLIADLFPAKRRGKAMALYMFGSMIAFGLGTLLTGYVLEAAPRGAFDALGRLSEMAPWRVAFILAGLVGLVLAAIFLPMREPRKKAGAVSSEAPRESRRANIAQGVGEMLREWRLFLPLYGGLAFYGMGVSIAVYWSPMVMTRVFGYSIEQTSKALGTGNIVWAALGSLSAGFVLDRVVRRWGSKGLLRFAGILAIVALPSVLAVFAGRGELALVLLTSIAFASCLFGSSMLSVIADVSPPQVRGLAISFYAFFMTLVGASLGPVLVAFLTEHVFHSDGAVGLSLAVIGTVAFAGCAVLMTLASVAIGRRA